MADEYLIANIPKRVYNISDIKITKQLKSRVLDLLTILKNSPICIRLKSIIPITGIKTIDIINAPRPSQPAINVL